MALAPALDLRQQADPRDIAEKPLASVEAEQALLGALLYGPEWYRRIAVELRADQFYEPFHGRVWQAIVDTINDGEIPDPTFLAEEFRRDAAFLELGGVRYLADLVDRSPAAARAPDYARHIVEMYCRREVLRLGQEMIAGAQSGAIEAAEILDTAEREVGRIRVEGSEPGNFLSAKVSGAETLEEIEQEAATGRPRGAQTGLRCFDTRMGGLPPTWLITIGGRPGMGKTALARATLYSAADRNRHRTFGFFSLEAPAREISERAISAATARDLDWVDVRSTGSGAVQLAQLSRSNVGLTERPWLGAAVERLPENLFLFDNAYLSLGDVRRAVWAMKAHGDLAAIAIDYLQLMQREQTRGRSDAALIGDITTGLKRLAMEAEICILLVSQLNRDVDRRDDKRPVLADLRESGSIEQDSNAVMFPYREAYYLARAEPKNTKSAEHEEWEARLKQSEDLLEVITAKLRQGRPGTDRQLYLTEYDAVSDWTKD